MVSHIRSQRENSLRTSGYIYRGKESPRMMRQLVLALSGCWLGDILVIRLLGETNLKRKLKIYGSKISRSRKAVVTLARRTRSRHWFVTLVLLSLFFFSFFFFFNLWWILSYIEMKQPRVYMCSPFQSPLPPPLPLHQLPLGFPSAPGPSTCLMHPTWAGDLFHPR